jgi:hypothetical protein
MRDFDVFVHTTADPRTGIAPQHLRYRFKHCVYAAVTSALSPQVWSESLDDRLVAKSIDAERWSRSLGIPFYEATIETSGHNLSLVVADLIVDVIAVGYAPFVVTDDGPESVIPPPLPTVA